MSDQDEGIQNQAVTLFDPLSLTLSRGERGLLRHPPAGEGVNGTAVNQYGYVRNANPDRSPAGH